MAKPDRHFINVFSAVLGVLVAIALVLLLISRVVDSGPTGARDVEDPLMQASAHERIKPFGEVAVAGRDNTGLAIEKTPTVVASAAAPPGGVRPRRVAVPVLRVGGREPRSRRAAVPRGAARLGERRGGVPAVQREEGRPHPVRGRHAAPVATLGTNPRRARHMR